MTTRVLTAVFFFASVSLASSSLLAQRFIGGSAGHFVGAGGPQHAAMGFPEVQAWMSGSGAMGMFSSGYGYGGNVGSLALSQGAAGSYLGGTVNSSLAGYSPYAQGQSGNLGAGYGNAYNYAYGAGGYGANYANTAVMGGFGGYGLGYGSGYGLGYGLGYGNGYGLGYGSGLGNLYGANGAMGGSLQNVHHHHHNLNYNAATAAIGNSGYGNYNPTACYCYNGTLCCYNNAARMNSFNFAPIFAASSGAGMSIPVVNARRRSHATVASVTPTITSVSSGSVASTGDSAAAATVDPAEFRKMFLAGRYVDVVQAAGQATEARQEDARLHEVLSLGLFALGDYRDAAIEAHAVLHYGTPADWQTVYRYYEDVKQYTDQLRELEAEVKDNPDDAASVFLLGYHYSMLGHKNDAITTLTKAVALAPQDAQAKQLLYRLAGTQPAPSDLPPQPLPSEDSTAATP